MNWATESFAHSDWDSTTRSRDAFPVLATFLVLLSVIPALLVVPGLGAAGRPSALLGLAMFGWWLVTRLLPPSDPSTFVAIRWALFLYTMVFVASMIAGLDRGLDGLEARSMYRSLLLSLGSAGVILVLVDGVRSRASIERVLRWMVALGVVGAIVGVAQFQFRYDLAEVLRIPGLVQNNEAAGIGERGSGLARVRGFALHPIEFGVVLGMLLPISLHLAAHSRILGWKRWFGPSVIAVGIPISISRSAVIALAVGMAVYAIGWTWKERSNFVIASVGFVVAFQLITPGLLGTIRSLFANIRKDDSVSGRTEDFSATARFIEERPWLGRGAGTFVIDRYRTLDNEYLGALLTTGFLGLASLVLILVCAGLTAIWLARNSPDRRVRSLSRALGADIAISIFVFATFDSLSFPIYAGILAIVIGCLGALYRFEKLSVLGNPSEARPVFTVSSRRDTTVKERDR